MEEKAAHPDRSRRYFAIGFKDSNVRIVFPTDDDPLRYQQQVVASEGMLNFVGPDDTAG